MKTWQRKYDFFNETTEVICWFIYSLSFNVLRVLNIKWQWPTEWIVEIKNSDSSRIQINGRYLQGDYAKRKQYIYKSKQTHTSNTDTWGNVARHGRTQKTILVKPCRIFFFFPYYIMLYYKTSHGIYLKKKRTIFKASSTVLECCKATT